MDQIMTALTGFIQSGILPLALMIARVLVVLMSLYVIWRCYTSFKKGQRRKDPVIMLVNHDARLKYPVLYWENSIGRSRSCDIVLPHESVSRDHAVLMRRENGWIICDTGSKGGVTVNGQRIEDRRVVNLGDEITIGGNNLTLVNADQEPALKHRLFRGFSLEAASPLKLMLITSLVFLLMGLQLCLRTGELKLDTVALVPFAFLMIAGWVMFIVSSLILRRVSFEMETMGMLLSGIGLLVISGDYPGKLNTQMGAIVLGVLIFYAMIWFMEDLERAKKFRYPIAGISLAALLATILFGTRLGGAVNWIYIGPFSLQTSELVKIAYVFVGASTLDKLQTKKNMTEFLVFTAASLGFLFLMKDFGTALIFFATFLIIAFMRSGSVRTIVLILGGAVLGLLLILRFMSHVADRFSNWGHIWEDPQGGGYQQTRMLTYFASGGLLGVGLGEGYLNEMYASETDLFFGVICEEMGILMGIVVVMGIIMFSLYARSDVNRSRSTFYSISACGAAGLMLFQMCLHVFGQSDILPFTGVTFPFLSAGGSSMMSVWGMLAFLKASDERTYAARRMTRKQMRETDEQIRRDRLEREMQRRYSGRDIASRDTY